MKKRIVVAVVILSLLLPSLTPQRAAGQVTCTPLARDKVIVNQVREITVAEGIIRAKIYWAQPSGGGQYPALSLAGGVMTHSYPGDATSLEARAVALADRCISTLIFHHRGQGPNLSDTPEFDFWSDQFERNDLKEITDEIIIGPIIPGQPELRLVNPDRLGIIGFSQAAINAWLAVADADLRGLYKVAIPWDGYPLSVDRLMGQSCINANMAQFASERIRRDDCPVGCDPITCPLVCGNIPGVTWREVPSTRYAPTT